MMDYNTNRKYLVLPEYGRNIQKMVLHLKTVEDRDERNRLAQAVIHIMGNMNPHLRDVADFKHKLWDHLAIISDFELDVDSPYPTPSREELQTRPAKLPYMDVREIKFMHYGRVLETMIKKAMEFPEGEEKDFLVELIANQMKKSYLNWNRDSVNDELILHDLELLSRGELKIGENLKLKETKDLLPKPVADKKPNKGAGSTLKKKTNKPRK